MKKKKAFVKSKWIEVSDLYSEEKKLLRWRYEIDKKITKLKAS